MVKPGSVILAALICTGAFSNKCAAQAKTLRTIVVDAGHGGSDAGAVAVYENSLRSKEKDVTLAISMKLVDELQKQLPDIKVVPTRTTDVFDDPRVKAKKANDAKGDLFLCIHADSGPIKTGRRQTGMKMVSHTKVTYTKKGKKRIKHTSEYQVEEPVYEYFKMPLTAKGTSIYIFNARKTGDKLHAIMKGDDEMIIDADGGDTTLRVDYTTPEGKQLANIYAKLYQEKSDRIAGYVNDEIKESDRPALGVHQRETGIWVLSATRMPAILVETGYINNPEDERYINSDKGQQEIAEAITRAVIRYKNTLESTKAGADNSK